LLALFVLNAFKVLPHLTQLLFELIYFVVVLGKKVVGIRQGQGGEDLKNESTG
jgi:hypothetical protein